MTSRQKAYAALLDAQTLYFAAAVDRDRAMDSYEERRAERFLSAARANLRRAQEEYGRAVAASYRD